MKPASIKARWVAKLMRTKSFIVVTDTESVIFSEHTSPFRFKDYMSAYMQLRALIKFQTALNKTVYDFERGLAKRFDAPKKSKARKIKVKVAK